jgi:selenocysteine lyase/cysteine desulfurase
MGEYEFPTMGQIWLAQQVRGARVQFIDGVGYAIPTERYEQAIDRSTRIVPLTHVSFVTGHRSDVPAIARIAHASGALVFLDGYQDCGTRPIDVKALDVDFYVTGTLKYLLGPPGLAFLYVRRELIETLTPTMTSWFSQREIFAFDPKRLDLAPTARRFENGAPVIPSIYLARPAIDLLSTIGLANVAVQIERLTQAFLAGAARLGIATKTPDTSVGPLVVLRSHDPAAALAGLTARGVVVSTRRDGVRFAFHVYNTLADVETALAALETVRDFMVRT